LVARRHQGRRRRRAEPIAHEKRTLTALAGAASRSHWASDVPQRGALFLGQDGDATVTSVHRWRISTTPPPLIAAS